MSILTEQEQHQFNNFLTDFESPPAQYPPTFAPVPLISHAPYPPNNPYGHHLPHPHPYPPPHAHAYHYPIQHAHPPYQLKPAQRDQQARELSAWMGAQAAAGTKGLAQWERDHRQEQRAGPGRRVSEEEAARADDTLRRLEQAERAAGFGSGELSGRARSGERKVGIAAVEDSNPPLAPLPTLPTTTKQTKAAPKPKQPKTKPAPPPPPPIAHDPSPTQSQPDSAVVISAPYQTPQNIPPSPPGRIRPLPPQPVASTSKLPPLPPTPAPQASPPAAGATASTGAPKPALLSAQQKKANHIASESRRRAQIRKGYDRLVEVVPALRAAVEAEKAEAAAGRAAKGKKGAKGKKVKGEGADEGGDKMDGRSGPKSEAVVLTKTVDRVQELLATRVALLDRLSHAYAQASDARRPVPAGPRKWEDKYVGSLEDEDGEGEGEWDDAGEE